MVGLVSFLSAMVPAVVLLVLGIPFPIVVVALVAGGVTGLLIAGSTRAGERRDTDRIQIAAVTLADWAHRNDGRSETDPDALRDGAWELPATSWFYGTVLAVGRREGFEVGVTCFLEATSEGAPTRHTGHLVHLPEPVPELRLSRAQLRRIRRGRTGEPIPDLVRERLAAVPPDTESLDVADQVLFLVRPRWPEFAPPDEHVDAAVAVAAALGHERGRDASTTRR
ncbi:MAG: hypothetical protein GEV28_03235 [Actinophytocola sp.]|uniref:hypothetical protein n=1 Tax=Actinophytocola sp. TaxID=1872138 RepID=UPI00132973A4|nr:hypothetical protein [Actinophytocola sp.]MPZ79447.1 hypothetical protein [Actinophytocola sp.]